MSFLIRNSKYMRFNWFEKKLIIVKYEYNYRRILHNVQRNEIQNILCLLISKWVPKPIVLNCIQTMDLIWA